MKAITLNGNVIILDKIIAVGVVCRVLDGYGFHVYTAAGKFYSDVYKYCDIELIEKMRNHLIKDITSGEGTCEHEDMGIEIDEHGVERCAGCLIELSEIY